MITYIVPANYELMQTCNESENKKIYMYAHQVGGGVFLKTNIVLGDVKVSATKLDLGAGGAQNVFKIL